MEKQDKSHNKKKNGFERYLVPCPNCGKDILYHMTQCPFCKAEVTPQYYKPMNPETAKKIKLVLAVIGFIVALILLFAVNKVN